MPFATVGVPPFSQLANELSHLTDPTFWTIMCPYVFLMAIVCFQVKWILAKHTEKLSTKTESDMLKLERLQDEIEQRLNLQEDRFATFQETVLKNQEIHENDIMNIQTAALKRLSFLEGLFSGLAASEHALNSTVARRLRLQVETGGLWGKQLRELQDLSKAADEREHAWLKATAYSPV